jgi:actin-related protein 5
MVDIPDTELDDEGKKEKRKQRLLKSNYDARMRMKAEKRAEKERIVSQGIIRVLPFRMSALTLYRPFQAEEKRKDEEAREADPIAWANKLRQDHLVSPRPVHIRHTSTDVILL